MITKVMGNNLKRKDFDLPIGQRTLIVGPNKSGKTAIVAAIQLAVNGYVPGIDKKNGAIFEALASSNRMTAGVEIGKTSLVKQFAIDGEKVSQSHTVNLKSATGKAYAAAMGAAGNPRVFDISTFTGLSDDKKIALIFDMFPPAEDIGAIESEIDALDAEKKSLEKSAKEAKGVCKRLLTERTEIDLPAGTLAETTLEIKRRSAELKLATKALRDAEIKEAEEAATKRAEEKQKKAADTAAAKLAEEKRNAPEPEQAPFPDEPPPLPSTTTQNRQPPAPTREPEPTVKQYTGEGEDRIRKIHADDVNAAIAAIEDAAEQAGCAGMCAVVMVSKRAIRKLTG